MSPRVQAQTIQKRLRTPRIPFLVFRSDLVFEALTKRDFFFDQSFFIAKDSLHILALMKRVFLFDQSSIITKDSFHILALMKRGFLFDQSFFITDLNKLFRLFSIIVFKIASYKKLFPQYYICFQTSVI